MKKSISLWQFAGFVFTSLLGTLLHFMFEWTDESLIVAPFSAVNESTWEHMKILFFPLFIFAILESRFFVDEYKDFWCIKLKGISLGVICIPILFYALNGIFGKTPDWINITIFFISDCIAYVYETKHFKRQNLNRISPLASIIILAIFSILFIILTFLPPQIPLFKDPLSNYYGLPKI